MDEKLIPKEASGPNESLSESNSLRNSVVAIETLHSDAGEPDPKPMVEVRELLQLILPVYSNSFPALYLFCWLATWEDRMRNTTSMPRRSPLLYANLASMNKRLLMTVMYVTAQSFGLGLAFTLDMLCSQAYGAKRIDKIGIYFQTGGGGLFVALIPILVVNSFTEPILNLLGQHTDVTNLTRDFSRLMLPGLPFLFLYELVRKVMQCQNVVKPLVVIAVIGNLCNLGAGYWLAYHTSMGFIGIAVARSLGNITLTLLLVPYFMWRPHQLRDW
ncbi:hypothetical protein F442_17996 [Phytophthora nicotianae P10297]|uniref:Polysaccharide biosynthesis protein C-terminal domain-containing protein n=1 Tax=Phytophthora nicotianae P10297 TaxID=1317064 RepID=W2YF96_PHYNI|nr:hypothetical protein F442_17996 [Phytophthora nicotianae P10297]